MSELNTFANKSDTKTIIRFVKEIERHPCLYDQKSLYYIDRELKKKTWNSIARKANTTESEIIRKDPWSGMYSFSKMLDSKSVVGFVKDIEINPCLYDTNSPDYVSRRKAWMGIAKKWNCTVAECKEKWRKIRTAYSRSLKPKYRDNKLMPYRPYYLSSYLKFLTPRNPLKKGKAAQSNTNPVKIETTSDEDNELTRDSDDKLDTQDETPIEFIEENCFNNEDNESSDGNASLSDNKNDIDTFSNEESKAAEVKKVREVKVRNNRNNERNGQRCSYCANMESKPRKMLLFSLLPDIEALSDQQMRTFRRELIDLIDRCKYDVSAGE